VIKAGASKVDEPEDAAVAGDSFVLSRIFSA